MAPGRARGASDPIALDAPWTRSAPACVVRTGIVCGVFGPLMDFYTDQRVMGREHLEQLEAPVVFAANHASHMDTPAVLRALPFEWRRRTAVAAAADYFYKGRRMSLTVALSFGTVPIGRNGGEQAGNTIELLERLIGERWNLLLYPEGTRSRDGKIGQLKSGAAVLAAEHGMPIVPVCVQGSQRAMPSGQSWPQPWLGRLAGERYPMEIRFGAPIVPGPGEDRREVMNRVRRFYAECGAQTAA